MSWNIYAAAFVPTDPTVVVETNISTPGRFQLLQTYARFRFNDYDFNGPAPVVVPDAGAGQTIFRVRNRTTY